VHLRLEAEPARLRFEVPLEFAIADEDPMDPGIGLLDPRGSVHQMPIAFLRDEPPDRQHDRRVGDHRAQPLLAGAQLAGGPVPLGQVLDLAEEAERAPLRVAQHRGADQQLQPGAVGTPAAPLDLERRLAALLLRGGAAQVGERGDLARVGELVDGERQQLVLGPAEQLAEGAVDALEATVQADERHPDRGLVEPEAEVHPAPLLTRRAGQPRPAVSDE